MESSPHRSICLVGAGHISAVHAEALRLVTDTELTAVCDADGIRASRAADRHDVDLAFGSLEEAIQSQSFDFAHVLTPPDHHNAVAERLLDAGIGVLVEKPLGISRVESRGLLSRAAASGTQLGVNHNAVFFPAYLKLRDHLRKRAVGDLAHLVVTHSLTPAGLSPPGHWMLRRPENLVYEAAVHPFSQIYDLAGPLVAADVTVSGRHDLGHGEHYFDTWLISLVCERATAQVFMSFAGAYRSWEVIAICQDGILAAEIERNRFSVSDRTRWGPCYEPMHLALSHARRELGSGIAGFHREALAAVRPVPRRDAYFASMRDSIAAFHHKPPPDRPRVDGLFGDQVIVFCEAVARSVAGQAVIGRLEPPAAEDRPTRPGHVQAAARCDAAILGGTGFIGTCLAEQMVEAGMTVRVMGRNVRGLAKVFERSEVEVLRGDIADADAVRRAISNAKVVVHLAHGGNFSWEGVQASMIDPANCIAESCIDNDVEALVYAGSIASLYLGDPTVTVSGATPTDPKLHIPYGWGKARSEDLLLRYVRERSLPVSIVRPGIVLGAGASPFHFGFGMWKGEVHCMGWNQGTNPLPLVLVSDVATAMLLAAKSPTAVGKTYNLAGDVRLCARECVNELGHAMGRPLVFHGRHPAQNLAVQMSKWLIKAGSGNLQTPLPRYRTIRSLGCCSPLDCADVKRDLGWSPVQDPGEFVEGAFRVHASNGSRADAGIVAGSAPSS
jgi:predicted dehydrogenase/nucleoside-diphosphate-sugar epimerase